MLEKFRNYIPVESFSRERILLEEISIPEIGLRWGAPSVFEYETPQSAAQTEKDKRGGFSVVDTYVDHNRIRHEVNLIDYSPVWREYDIVRIYMRSRRSDGSFVIDYETYVDVQSTISMLIPISKRTLQYISGRDGEGNAKFKDRNVDTYLRMYFPRIDAERIGSGTEGEWPRGRTEILEPGKFNRPSPRPWYASEFDIPVH